MNAALRGAGLRAIIVDGMEVSTNAYSKHDTLPGDIRKFQPISEGLSGWFILSHVNPLGFVAQAKCTF